MRAAAVPQHASPLRLALVALCSLLPLAAVATIAYELAAARVPQHRAALEELIRHETGLEVRFAALSLRWGWYGPEAVFHDVELREPDSDAVRLRAPRLSAALDTWRMLRSGRFEAGRITLLSPDIDVGAGPGAGAASVSAARARTDLLGAGTRLLARWRGGQVDIQSGTLHAALAGAALPVALSIRHARLLRIADRWSADAELLLPEALGAAAHVSLEMHGDPATPAGSGGTLGVQGERLELAGWRALVPNELARYLPGKGNANLDLHATFAGGLVSRLTGSIQADSLAWEGAGGAIAVQRLKGEWQLARLGAEWRLSATAVELAVPSAALAPVVSTASVPATLRMDLARDGAWMRGSAQHAPIAALAALARFFVPQLPLGQVALGGETRELTFDWSARRPGGARLTTAAALADLSVASSTGDLVLSGLSAHVSGTDSSLVAELQAPAGQLTVTRAGESYTLDQLGVLARLTASGTAGSWRLSADSLDIQRQDTLLSVRGALGAGAAGAASLDARLALRNADAAVIARLLGPQALATLGAAARVRTGRIESAEVLWHGPIAAAGADGSPVQVTGTLQLRDGTLDADGDWPDASGVDARLVWRGPQVHAVIDRAQAGGFQLIAATADWNTQRPEAWHFGGRVSGSAQQALAWLRAHPAAASACVPGLSSIDLRGDTVVDLDAAPPRLRVTAVLDGGELRPLAGLPPIGALRGTLVFAAGQLQRSTLSGEWLGGPVNLGLSQRRERAASVLTLSAHGSMGARQAVQAAGGNVSQMPLSGTAEWNAQLTYLPGSDAARARWVLRADSSLVGLTSHLPEPFAKSAGTPLALRVELQAAGEAGQLRISLAERLTALAALTRRGDAWRIERGAVRLAGTAPVLPAEPIVLLDGRVSRLDLVAGLGLLRQAAADQALPPVHAHLSTAQLLAGTRSYPDIDVAAQTSVGGGGVLQLQGAAFSGSARWPAAIDPEHPAIVHLSRLSLAQLADAAPGAAVATVLAPATQLFIDDLQWQGRPLGKFGATLASRDDLLEARDAYLSGASGETHGGARCRGTSCDLTFSLDSEDAAATLVAFGLRPEMRASHASLEGELHWSGAGPAPLATLGGHLHMQLDDGTTQPGGSDTDGAPFALLSVPALLAGLSTDNTGEAPAALRFARVTADYELHDGDAMTRDLHFDGDAEILLRGRVGLAARDYDQQAWILRGEDRLPSAVRRLGPTPRVAAVWLSLRELFTGAGTRARDALRLRGGWDDPIVIPAQ